MYKKRILPFGERSLDTGVQVVAAVVIGFD